MHVYSRGGHAIRLFKASSHHVFYATLGIHLVSVAEKCQLASEPFVKLSQTIVTAHDNHTFLEQTATEERELKTKKFLIDIIRVVRTDKPCSNPSLSPWYHWTTFRACSYTKATRKTPMTRILFARLHSKHNQLNMHILQDASLKHQSSEPHCSDSHFRKHLSRREVLPKQCHTMSRPSARCRCKRPAQGAC